MKKDLKKIVWLASYPKSGNTWFRVFLSNVLVNRDAPFSLNELLSTPISSSRALFDEYSNVSGSDLTIEEIQLLQPLVYRQEASEANELIFHKVHDAWKTTSSGVSIFPYDVTKAVIYIIRNPLDVAVSFAFHSGKTPTEIIKQMNNPSNSFCGKPNKLYNQLRQELSDWSGHVLSWVDRSGLPVKAIRYEDMLQNTNKTFTDALKFIGISKNNQEIENAIKASEFKTLSAKEQLEGFYEKPLKMNSFFRSGTTGDWRNHLSDSEVKSLTDKHQEVMKRFGYGFEKR